MTQAYEHEHDRWWSSRDRLTAGYRRRLAFVLEALGTGREPVGDWRTALHDLAADLDAIVTRAERMRAAGIRHPALDDVDDAQSAMGCLAGVWLSADENEALYLGGEEP